MKNRCVICKEDFKGHGHNPKPLVEFGVCCDRCNLTVILQRLKEMEEKKNEFKS